MSTFVIEKLAQTVKETLLCGRHRLGAIVMTLVAQSSAASHLAALHHRKMAEMCRIYLIEIPVLLPCAGAILAA